MSRQTGPKGKVVRRFGQNLFGTDKYDKVLAKRNYPPGVHGKGKFSKPTEFGKQLLEKQKLRLVFGITERQCRNYYLRAVKSKEKTAESFMSLLERRLDNVVYRSGLAKTRSQARQYVSHGVFLLNGKRMKVPSAEVREGDTFEVREKLRKSPMFQGLEKLKITPPSWVKVDVQDLKGQVLRYPTSEEFEKILAPSMIIEYYSK